MCDSTGEARFMCNFNVGSRNHWEWFIINRKTFRKGTLHSGRKMLSLWTCWFQGVGRASRWRFPTVSWKWHCTWQIAGLGYRNESSRAFLKSWSCGLTGIILFLRVETLRSIQLWRTDHREEEREENIEEAWHLECAFWPVKGLAAQVEIYVLQSSWIYDLFPLLCLAKPLPSLSCSLSYPVCSSLGVAAWGRPHAERGPGCPALGQ